MNKVIAVDFDGTICRSKWPDIGEANNGLIEWLKACRENGDKLILYTCREGDMLRAALMWCIARGLEFDAVNDNLPERIQQYGGNSRKISADIYLDDRAIGVYYPPRQSVFYTQGTKGTLMFADVDLTTQDMDTGAGYHWNRSQESGVYGLDFEIQHAAPVPPGYQYRPEKRTLRARIRDAFRVLCGGAV